MDKPVHIAIIMDGNGRWARSRSRPRTFGHRQGVKALEKTARAAADMDIDHLTVFAFSTENWARPGPEVRFLFQLLRDTINDELDRLQKEEDIEIKIMGRRDELEDDIQDDIERIERISAGNDKLRLNVALNYGGRAEIIDAVNSLIERGEGGITEEDFSRHLYLPELPDVDLLIRTGGERRISNFMLWQISYAELYFSSCLWPDFGRENLERALDDFRSRTRRFGRIPAGEEGEKGE